jgi:basic amino acid/polyamine antiporter, APA family
MINYSAFVCLKESDMDEAVVKRKELGVVQLTALVFGNMVGSGTFMLPAALASYGSIGLCAWMATACGAVFLALVFSRLSKVYPKSGGPYAYCRQAYGDFVGFQIAYCYWIATWVGNAAIVVALMGSMVYFFPILKDPHYSVFFSLVTLWSVTAVNMMGVKQAGIFQVVTSVVKFVPLIGMAVLGLFYMDFDALQNFNVSGESNMSAFAATAALAVWSFIGLESATIPAGEAKNPGRDIPLATVLGTLLAALVYILSTGVIMGLIPMATLAQSGAPFVLAAQALFGSWGGQVMAVISIVAIMGTLNGWILMQAQMPMAAAKDGMFPQFFCRLGKNGTPVYGLVVSSLLISGLLFMHSNDGLVQQFTLITELAVVATLIPYLYSSLAEIVFMIKHPERYQERSKRIRVTLLALVAFMFVFLAFIGVEPEVILYVMLLFFSSVAAYMWLLWSQRQ